MDVLGVLKKMQALTARRCRVCNKQITSNSYRSLHCSKMYHKYLIEMGLSVEGFLCRPCVRKLDRLIDIDDKLSGGLHKTRADLIILLRGESEPPERILTSQSVSSPTIPESKSQTPLHLGYEGDRWKKMKETLRMATDAMLAKHLLDIHQLYCSCDVDVKNTSVQDDILMNEKREDIMDSGEGKRKLQIDPKTQSKIMRICPSSGVCTIGASSSDLGDQELKSQSVEHVDGDGVNVEAANPDTYNGLHSDTNSEEDRKLMAGEDFIVYKAEVDDNESSEDETNSDVTMAVPGVTMVTHTNTMVTDRLPVKQEMPDSDDDDIGNSTSKKFADQLCADPQGGTDHSSFPIKEEPLCSDSGLDPQDVSTQPTDSFHVDHEAAGKLSPSVEAGVLIFVTILVISGLMMKLASFVIQKSRVEPRPEMLESLVKQKPQ